MDIPPTTIKEEQQPTPNSQDRDASKTHGTTIVLEDGGEGKARIWRICSENKVNVRTRMTHDSERLRYLLSGEEFEAEGPYKLANRGERFQWLKLTGKDGGFVCTYSAKDENKVIASLKRKQSSKSQETSATGKPVDRALIIKPCWIQKIFEKGKVWEIRGHSCKKRGRFAIGASGTGMLVGEATMINCLKAGKLEQEAQEKLHWTTRSL